MIKNWNAFFPARAAVLPVPREPVYNRSVTQSTTIVELVRSKLNEQAEMVDHLVSLIPAHALDWKPTIPVTAATASPFSVGELLGHLLDCLAGFCATLYAAYPSELSHFVKLRELPVNHRCEVEEARARLREYAAHVKEGFALLTEADLLRGLPAAFVEDGEPLLTLLLGNLEHLINHKHQLFTYLKQMGIQVTTRDLYRFR